MGVLPARRSRSPGVRRGFGQLRSRRGRCGCGHDRTDPFRGDNPVSPARPHLQRTPSLRPNREPPKRTRTTGRWIIGSGFARRTSLSDHGASTDRRCSAGRRYAGYLSKFSQTTKSRGTRSSSLCSKPTTPPPRTSRFPRGRCGRSSGTKTSKSTSQSRIRRRRLPRTRAGPTSRSRRMCDGLTRVGSLPA